MLFLSVFLMSAAQGQNIALNKPVTTSSNDESGTMPGSNAVDGNTTTRWASDWSDPQWIDIDLQATYDISKVVLRWETAAAKAYQIQVSSDNTNWTSIYSTTTGPGGVETLNITGTGRYIRMYGTVRATSYGYSLYEFEVYGSPAASVPVSGVTLSPANASVSAGDNTQLTATVSPSNATNSAITWSSSNPVVAIVNSSGQVTGVAAGSATITATTLDGSFKATSSITVTPALVNVALNKQVTTSSDDPSGTLPGSNAVDGSTSTRWGSVFTDPQWIDVDLLVPYDISKVVLRWETAAAKAYQIQVSYDNIHWTTIYSTTNGAGGTEILNITGTGRYIRMYGTARATTFGYSLYEFEVYGTAAANVTVSGVTISPATVSVAAGDHTQLTALVSPSNATHNDVSWATSDATIATVSSTGMVTGVAPGNVSVIATTKDGGKTNSASISVVGVPVTAVSLPVPIPVYIGGSIQLSPVISPSNATDKKVSWASSDTTVAKVSSTGLLTGMAVGSTTVTVTADDGQFTANEIYKIIAAPADKFKVGVTWSSEYLPGDASWFTSPKQSTYQLTARDSLAITKPVTSSATTFNVNPAKSYQTIYGMGSSFEESTVYNLLQMSQTKRTEALRLLCDPINGAGLNLWRLTIGTSDFTGRAWYTYDDMPAGQTDTSLSHFSIQKDKDYGLIQIIKEAQAINPNIRFFASPWSPPAWMKSPVSLLGGTLADGMYQILAKYYRRYIEAYAAEGIPIYAITIQNEPGQVSSSYPNMGLSSEQEIELTKAIKAEFNAHGITTKVWIFDFNFSQENYALSVLADPGAYAAADGTAFHDYAGYVSAMTDLHNTYPNKEIFFTERSFWGVSGMDRIAQYFRNYASSYNSWVTMLDQNKKPNNGGGGVDPTLLIKGTSSADQYWAIPEVYLFGQYARFVQYGAKRIESNYGTSGGLTNVAFRNPDGSIVMVVMNNSATNQSFQVLCEGNQFLAQLPAKTAGTYVWQSGLPSAAPIKDTSTAQHTGFKLLALYPNPVSNNTVEVRAEGFNKDEKVNISVYDSLGRKVCESDFTADNNGKLETPVNLNQLISNHIYVITIKGDSHEAVGRKLIVR